MESIIIQSQVNAIEAFLTDFAAHNQTNGEYGFSLRCARDFMTAQSNLLPVAPAPTRPNCAPRFSPTLAPIKEIITPIEDVDNGSDTDEDSINYDAYGDAKTGDEFADDSSDDLSAFDDEPKYASWADEMDGVDPITTPALHLIAEEPNCTSWADEMDEVDPIITPVITPALPIFAADEPKYASWADEMDDVDPIITPSVLAPAPVPGLRAAMRRPGRKADKKSVRFTYEDEVFEIPHWEEARKIDPKYWKPKRPAEGEDDDEEEEEKVVVVEEKREEDEYEGYGAYVEE